MGAQNHRRVDIFTDTHPLFPKSKARIGPRFNHFHGILVDIFYDHVLARHWKHYHAVPLNEYVQYVHDCFLTHEQLMPETMRAILPRMIQQNWLAAYATVEGIKLTLERMSQRITQRFDHTINLAPASEVLKQHRDGFTDDFHAFFAQTIECVHWAQKTAPLKV